MCTRWGHVEMRGQVSAAARVFPAEGAAKESEEALASSARGFDGLSSQCTQTGVRGVKGTVLQGEPSAALGVCLLPKHP